MGRETEESSYIIFKDGNLYKAKNGTTGCIEFSSTDAAWVINSAKNALSAGGRILFRTGKYILDNYIDFSTGVKENIVLEGEEPCKAILTQPDGRNLDPLIYVLEAKKITIRNLALDANGQKQTKPTYGTACARIFASDDITIEGCRLLNATGESITFYVKDTIGCNRVVVRNCHVDKAGLYAPDGTTRSAIHAGYSADVKYISNTVISKPSASLHVGSCKQVVIANNIGDYVLDFGTTRDCMIVGNYLMSSDPAKGFMTGIIYGENASGETAIMGNLTGGIEIKRISIGLPCC